VTTVDVSWRAVLNARINAALNGVRVDARRGDLLEAVAGESFGLILANPPYVPGPPPPKRGAARATDADGDGRAVLDRICAQAPAPLNPGGGLLIVQSEVGGTETTLAALERSGLTADVVARQRGPLEPLLQSRRDAMEARGQLEPGQELEEVVRLPPGPRADGPRGRSPAHAEAISFASSTASASDASRTVSMCPRCTETAHVASSATGRWPAVSAIVCTISQ
jgi:release factor glutamine methyltransferase